MAATMAIVEDKNPTYFEFLGLKIPQLRQEKAKNPTKKSQDPPKSKSHPLVKVYSFFV